MTERSSLSLGILSWVSGYQIAQRIIAVFRLEISLALLENDANENEFRQV